MNHCCIAVLIVAVLIVARFIVAVWLLMCDISTAAASPQKPMSFEYAAITLRFRDAPVAWFNSYSTSQGLISAVADVFDVPSANVTNIVVSALGYGPDRRLSRALQLVGADVSFVMISKDAPAVSDPLFLGLAAFESIKLLSLMSTCLLPPLLCSWLSVLSHRALCPALCQRLHQQHGSQRQVWVRPWCRPVHTTLTRRRDCHLAAWRASRLAPLSLVRIALID